MVESIHRITPGDLRLAPSGRLSRVRLVTVRSITQKATGSSVDSQAIRPSTEAGGSHTWIRSSMLAAARDYAPRRRRQGERVACNLMIDHKREWMVRATDVNNAEPATMAQRSQGNTTPRRVIVYDLGWPSVAGSHADVPARMRSGAPVSACRSWPFSRSSKMIRHDSLQAEW